MGDIIVIAIPLIIGYLIALAVYLCTTFVLASVFRHALAAEGRPLPGFYAASAFSWLLATFAACYYVVLQAPYPWEIVLMTLMLLAVLLKAALDFSQQSKRLVALCVLAVVSSASLVWVLVS